MELRKLKTFILIIIITILTILSLIPTTNILTPGLNDKALHFTAYIFLSFMTDFLLNKKIIYLITILFIYGLLIEFIQYFLPFRQFELLDIAANTAGIAVYFGFRYLFNKIYYKEPDWD